MNSQSPQQFYFCVKEARDWIQKKEPILKVRDIANDEDSVQTADLPEECQ